jgi:hypothetical protein
MNSELVKEDSSAAEEDLSVEEETRRKIVEQILKARRETARQALPQRSFLSRDDDSSGNSSDEDSTDTHDGLETQKANLERMLSARNSIINGEYPDQYQPTPLEEDCAEAMRDPDLLILYNEGVREQNENGKLALTEAVAKAARVILPGRCVDYIFAAQSFPTNPLEMREQLLSKMNRDETALILGVARKLLALYLRDYPEQATAEIHSMYAMFRMFSAGNSQSCSIL